jgi:glycerate kinase
LEVNNPLFRSIETWYGLKGDTAYIEMAKASGLLLLKEEERDPKFTSSLGTGELILDAIENGAKKIFLFIGGSATNDAAIGIASALGYKFFNSPQKELKPIGENLVKIKSIEYFPIIAMEDVKITVLTDVQNPFFGENGAAYVYAAQKGADEKSIEELDEGLRNISKVFENNFSINISNIPGSGAAGGIGGGMKAFFNATIRSGIDAIFEMLNFDNLLEDADYIITGEGKFDSQTFEGKVVKGVVDKAINLKKTIGVVCGFSTLTQKDFETMRITVKQIKTSAINFEESIKNAHKYLIERSEELIKSLSEE